LAELLEVIGRQTMPRAETTLVSFASADPVAERARLAEQDVVVRDIPGHPWLRASVGAWNDERDLERLLAGLQG
jgi:L-cysteine/cystine lyase